MCRGSSSIGPLRGAGAGAPLGEKKIEQVRKNQPEERVMGKRFMSRSAGLRRSVSRSPVRPWRRKGREAQHGARRLPRPPGRSAYQPVIHKQGNRWIAYVGTTATTS